MFEGHALRQGGPRQGEVRRRVIFFPASPFHCDMVVCATEYVYIAVLGRMYPSETQRGVSDSGQTQLSPGPEVDPNWMGEAQKQAHFLGSETGP